MHADKPRMTEFVGARWARLVAETGLTLLSADQYRQATDRDKADPALMNSVGFEPALEGS